MTVCFIDVVQIEIGHDQYHLHHAVTITIHNDCGPRVACEFFRPQNVCQTSSCSKQGRKGGRCHLLGKIPGLVLVAVPTTISTLAIGPLSCPPMSMYWLQ